MPSPSHPGPISHHEKYCTHVCRPPRLHTQVRLHSLCKQPSLGSEVCTGRWVLPKRGQSGPGTARSPVPGDGLAGRVGLRWTFPSEPEERLSTAVTSSEGAATCCQQAASGLVRALSRLLLLAVWPGAAPRIFRQPRGTEKEKEAQRRALRQRKRLASIPDTESCAVSPTSATRGEQERQRLCGLVPEPAAPAVTGLLLYTPPGS